jgi:hypothetical protein
MTKKKLEDMALARLEACAGWDTECRHVEQDEVLCDLLTQLGYGSVVEKWKSFDRWYA